MGFFERAWGSARTSTQLRDVIPISEAFKVQLIELVYPSDHYLFRDSAYAVRRSVHAYDALRPADYAVASKIPVIHAYDVVAVHDLAYASRRNVIHAYDVISQLDGATKSGNITLSVLDVLRTSEWFFRVSKALKLFEPYIPFETATVSTIPTIHVTDLLAYYDRAEISGVKAVSVFEKLVADGVSYTKSYSPLFFALFRRRAPVRYMTLSVSDNVGTSDNAVAKKVVVIPVSDYVVSDSASTRGVTTILAQDYGISFDSLGIKNLTIYVFNIIPVADYALANSAKAVEALDYLAVSDYADIRKPIVVEAFDGILTDFISTTVAKAVSVLDKLLSDSVATSKSYSPLLFGILRRRIPIRYLTLSVLDAVAIRDSGSAVKIKQTYASDYIAPVDSGVAKRVASVSASDYGLLSDSHGIKNLAIHAYDIIQVADYALTIKAKVIEVQDYPAVRDYADLRKVVVVSAVERLMADSVSTSKSYSPLLFTLLRRRVPITYRVLSVYDVVGVLDGASLKKFAVINAFDGIAADNAAYSKSISPLFFTLFRRKIPVRYMTLSVSDRVSVFDSSSVVRIKVLSVLDVVAVADYAVVKNVVIPAVDYAVYDAASVAPVKVVFASDYVMYDYVPHMNPRDVRYISLWANVGMRTVSVFDRIVPYESVLVGPRVITVHVRDHLVSDSATMVRRSIHAYDIIGIRENVNIVRL